MDKIDINSFLETKLPQLEKDVKEGRQAIDDYLTHA